MGGVGGGRVPTAWRKGEQAKHKRGRKTGKDYSYLNTPKESIQSTAPEPDNSTQANPDVCSTLEHSQITQMLPNVPMVIDPNQAEAEAKNGAETAAPEPVKSIKHTKKRLLQFQLLDNNNDPKSVLQITNNKPNVSNQAVAQLKHEHKKWLLTRKSTVKKAHNVIEDALEGKPFQYVAKRTNAKGEVVLKEITVAPTYTNRIAVAQMVYDRYEPLKQSDGGEYQAPQHPVNLALFLNVGEGKS